MAKRGKSIAPISSASPAERLLALFAGLPRARGEYRLSGTAKGKKLEGKANTVKRGPDVAAWQDHIDGKVGLGVIPIRDDDTCVWGAIDIDVYDGLKLEAVQSRVKELRLPLVVGRSKSGGAHLWLFLTEPASADLVRTKLMEAAIALGYAGCEVFPKQTHLAGPNDTGNWINMPYFNAAATQRFALGPKAGQLELIPFLETAEAAAIDMLTLAELTPDAADDFPGGPPCLQALATRGFPEGSRNNALFNMGVYLRKKIGEGGWDNELVAFNAKFIKPALPTQEVQMVIKSVRKKSYEYKCKEAPICQACSKQICLTREYGVRGGKTDPGVVFGELMKIPTDPPMYLWDVNGERLELTSMQLMDQRKFNQVCFEKLDIWPHPIRSLEWQVLVRERLEKVEISDAPAEASRAGRVWELLEDFCLSRAHGMSRDELLMKKPWTEEGKTYFRLADFIGYLEQQRLFGMTERQLWMILKKSGADHGRWTIKGRTVKWWAVPRFQGTTEPLDQPTAAGAGV